MDLIRLTAIAPIGVAYFGVEKDIEIPVAWNDAEIERRSVIDLVKDLGRPEIQRSTLGQRRGGQCHRNEAREEGNERKLATSPRTSMEKHRSLSWVVSSLPVQLHGFRWPSGPPHAFSVRLCLARSTDPAERNARRDRFATAAIRDEETGLRPTPTRKLRASGTPAPADQIGGRADVVALSPQRLVCYFLTLLHSAFVADARPAICLPD
jgi:hypothetical protein